MPKNPLGSNVKLFSYEGRGHVEKGDKIASLRKKATVIADSADLSHGKAVEVLTPAGGRFDVRRNDLRSVETATKPINLTLEEQERVQARAEREHAAQQRQETRSKPEQVRAKLHLTPAQAKALRRIAVQPGGTLVLGAHDTIPRSFEALFDRDFATLEISRTGLAKVSLTGKGDGAARQIFPTVFIAGGARGQRITARVVAAAGHLFNPAAQCPGCGEPLSVPAGAVKVRCPECNGLIGVTS